MQAGSVLHLCTKFETDCSIRSKVIKGSRNEEIKSRDRPRPLRGRCMAKNVAPSSVCTKFEAGSSFRSKIIRGSQISPHCRPLPGGARRPKFNQLEMVTTFTYKPIWWGSMHAISSYRGNTHTHTHTHRQDRLQYTVPQLASAQCNHISYSHKHKIHL